MAKPKSAPTCEQCARTGFHLATCPRFDGWVKRVDNVLRARKLIASDALPSTRVIVAVIVLFTSLVTAAMLSNSLLALFPGAVALGSAITLLAMGLQRRRRGRGRPERGQSSFAWAPDISVFSDVDLDVSSAFDGAISAVFIDVF
jgi:hypothetical protein